MAIAYQGSADLSNNSGGGTLTHSYTVNASSDILFVGFLGDLVSGHDDITGVTYAGSSMTLIAKTTTGSRFSYLYYLANPATGANNVVITSTNSHYLIAVAADYSGAATTGIPDADTAFATLGTATTLTPVASSVWGIMIGGCFQATISAQSGCTLRTHSAAFSDIGLFDTNASVGPGAFTMGWNGGLSNGSTDFLTSIVASFGPSGTIANKGSGDLGNNGGGGTLTKSYTVNASSNMLFVGFLGDSVGGHDDITGVTYNGASMTLVAKTTSGTSNSRYSYLYFLANPSTGANNVVITSTNSHYLIALAADYSGTAGTIDAHTVNAEQPIVMTKSISSITNNAWGIALGGCNGDSSNAITATTGTLRVQGASFHDICILDTNAAVSPAGSFTLAWKTTTGGQNGQALTSIMAAFAPVPPSNVWYPRPIEQDPFVFRFDTADLRPRLILVPPSTSNIWIPHGFEQGAVRQFNPYEDRNRIVWPYMFTPTGTTLTGNIISVRQTSATAITIYLPASPIKGKLYLITDTLGVCGSHNFAIHDHANNPITTMSTNGASVGLYHDGVGWVVAFS